MYTVLPDYTKIPGSVLRSSLLKVCKKQLSGQRISLTQYPLDAKRIYRSNWHKFVLHYLAEDWFESNKRLEYFEDIFSEIMHKDWSRVCIEACLYAWLCTDEERLHTLFPQDQELPTDLSYGLVLNHYEPVMRMACFFTRHTYNEERPEIPSSIIKEAKNYALSNTATSMEPVMDKKAVERIVNLLRL